jgi:hypothetical protein
MDTFFICAPTKTGMVKIKDRPSLLAFYGKDDVKFKELSGEPVL